MNRLARIVMALALLALLGVLVRAVLALPPDPASLQPAVLDSMPRTGVQHPLTAVLLNYRGYDTLLEIGVLLVAVLAVWSLDLRGLRELHVPPPPPDPVLRAASGILVPISLMTAGYMVWAGSFRPGGAFQAGAILGAVSVLLLSSGLLSIPSRHSGQLRAILAAGFLLFLAVALATVPAFGRLLQYPESAAGSLILIIESLLALSIGAALATLFDGVSDAVRAGSQP